MTSALIHAALILTADGSDPQNLTAAVGLEPTTSWRMGQAGPTTGRPTKCDLWELAVPKRRSLAVDPVICELLDSIESRKAMILAAAQRFGWRYRVSCVVDIEDEVPSFVLSATLIHRLADWDTFLDLDVYVSDP
jgi:hypothetical protein